MAKGRMLTWTIGHDPRVNQLTLPAALVYTWTIPHLDRDGKIRGYPSVIRGCVAARADREGWNDGDIASFMLEWWHTVDKDGRQTPLVLWYGDAPPVCRFEGFPKNQTLKGNEGPSVLPDPPVGEPLSPPPAFGNPQLQLYGPVREEKGREVNGPAAKAASSESPIPTGREQTEPAFVAATPPLQPQAAEDTLLATPPLQEPQAASDDVASVYEHWRHTRGRTSVRYRRISDKRRQKIAARLREFSVDELIRAIDAVAVDPWTDRARHDDITVIFRSREQVERFLEMAETRTRRRELPGGTDLAAYTRA